MENIINYINEGNYFVVTSHVNPDGDNVGSTLAIYKYLKSLGKEVFYVLNDEIPLNLKFLIKGVEIINSEEFKNLNISDYNLISLDCGDLGRICLDKDIIENASKLICIDHHASNDNFGDLNYVVADASSTCELVYDILKRAGELKGENVIDKDMATALYTGVVTDTGKFTYPSTKPTTFEMAKNLLILGADTDTAVCEVYRNNPHNYYKLLGEVLNTLQIVKDKIAVLTLTKDMLDRNNIDFKDADGITPYCIDISGVEVGILVKQKSKNTLKISLRSKKYVNVDTIASAFNGGGHHRAAGLTIVGNDGQDEKELIEDAIKNVVDETLKYI